MEKFQRKILIFESESRIECDILIKDLKENEIPVVKKDFTFTHKWCRTRGQFKLYIDEINFEKFKNLYSNQVSSYSIFLFSHPSNTQKSGTFVVI